MEISELTQASTQLLDALEKMGTSPGAELRSPSGPSGLPSAELVQALEAALNEPHAVEGSECGYTHQTLSVPVADASQNALDVNAAEAVFRPAGVTVVEATQEPAPSFHAMQESLTNVLSGTVSPEDLYKLQYHAGIFKLQASSGKGLSQEASQGLESLLKQQG